MACDVLKSKRKLTLVVLEGQTKEQAHRGDVEMIVATKVIFIIKLIVGENFSFVINVLLALVRWHLESRTNERLPAILQTTRAEI